MLYVDFFLKNMAASVKMYVLHGKITIYLHVWVFIIQKAIKLQEGQCHCHCCGHELAISA